jgi:hypothetical protein
VLRLRDGTGFIQECCYVNNDYSRAAVYVSEGSYLFSGNFGDNSPVPEPTCLDIILQNNGCNEFDSDLCLVPDPTMAPMPTSACSMGVACLLSWALAMLMGALLFKSV